MPPSNIWCSHNCVYTFCVFKCTLSINLKVVFESSFPPCFTIHCVFVAANIRVKVDTPGVRSFLEVCMHFCIDVQIFYV